MQQQGIIFDTQQPLQSKWRVPEPSDLPYLTGVKRISLDCETDSKNPFKANLVGVSIAYRTDSLKLNKLYAPVGHSEGNMDPDIVRRWLEYVLQDKEVCFCNGKFDLQVLRQGFNLDLEKLRVKPRDIAFPAALLDDSPFIDLSLDGIARRYVGYGKLEFEGDINQMAKYPSWVAGPYAERDAGVTLESDEAMDPLIEKEDLNRVLDLENDIIYAVCEIERNGCRLDVEKLTRWRREVEEEYKQVILRIRDMIGMLIKPSSAESMTRLFAHLNIVPPAKVEKKSTRKKKSDVQTDDKPKKANARTYKVEELLSLNHPVLNLVVDARRRESLLSRFLQKYPKGLEGDLLRAQFHQLKTSIDEDDEEEGKGKGVAWGRFSSSGGGDISSGYTFNAQQVIRADKQVTELGDSHIIRELFIPDEGMKWGSADAKQIEYKIFAALANAQSVINAYKNNPKTDYHGFVHDRIRPFKPHIDRTTVKNVNFAFAYGASPRTLAATGGISIKEAEQILEFCKTLLPERDPFINKCSYLAEHQGHVCTILGRRARFKKGDPFYKAVSRVIQGSAADAFKLSLRDLYREHKTLGITKLRQIVHDEFNYDRQPDDVYSKRIQEFLDEQRISLSIPITWETKMGENWRQCH